ncbi:MAG: DNA primase [Candidatus Binataceae bacterium]
MAPFSDTQLEEVRSRADIVEVIGAHVRLRKAGRNFVGLCPFHGEKTPSFTVSREKGFFHCFGCGAGGTVYNFLMRMEGVTFPEAVRSLANRYGITLPEERGDPRAGAEREAMLRAAEVACDFFVHVLWEEKAGAPAREYLKRRAIDIETATTFKLGFSPASPASLTGALTRRGLLEAGTKIGLVKGAGGQAVDMFRARLMFPIHDTTGRVIAFGGRVLDDRLPKYINSPESPLYSKARNLYGLAQARAAIGKSDRAIVVEGYIDAIALAQAGFKETVASLGTALTVDQLKLLGRYTRNVFACFDGDKAGHSASLRAVRTFVEAGLLGRGIFIPEGFDPDTLVKQRGAQSFAQLIDSAELLVDYFVRSEAATAGTSLSGRARAAEHVAELLAAVSNAFEFDLLTRKAAEMLGVSEEVLRAQGRKGARAPLRTVAQPRPTRPARNRDMKAVAEFGLLAVAAAYPNLREEILASGALTNFEDSNLAGITAELCASGDESGQAQLTQRLSAEQQSALSEQMLDPFLESVELARRMIGDYCQALALYRRGLKVKGLVETAHQGQKSANEGKAIAALEAVIRLRKVQPKVAE